MEIPKQTLQNTDTDTSTNSSTSTNISSRHARLCLSRNTIHHSTTKPKPLTATPYELLLVLIAFVLEPFLLATNAFKQLLPKVVFLQAFQGPLNQTKNNKSTT